MLYNGQTFKTLSFLSVSLQLWLSNTKSFKSFEIKKIAEEVWIYIRWWSKKEKTDKSLSEKKQIFSKSKSPKYSIYNNVR